LINQPELIQRVLKERPDDFPKSTHVNEGLRPLLGNLAFVTNGETWKRQRRIIDPAFEGGRLRETFPAMWAASEAAAARLEPLVGSEIGVEPETSHAAADVIFRTLFSLPIQDSLAQETFEAFRVYQRSQPILNLAALIPMPRWIPRLFGRDPRDSAARIRELIRQLTQTRADEIAAGKAPDDLATKIMTTQDPVTGETFSTEEMVD
jgi:cytochrome P450